MNIDSVGENQISAQSSNSIAARREARRRKILENAENRLRKLTGVEQKSHVLIDDFRPVQYEETTTDNHIQNSRLANEFLPNSIIDSTNQIPAFQASQVDSYENGLGKWKSNKLVTLIGISFLVNLFTMFSTILWDETEWNVGSNMIFLPFIGLKCLEYYLQKNSAQESNILLLCLMANMKNNNVKRLFIYMQYLTSFTQDLCVYFLVFVCMNQLFRITVILR